MGQGLRIERIDSPRAHHRKPGSHVRKLQSGKLMFSCHRRDLRAGKEYLAAETHRLLPPTAIKGLRPKPEVANESGMLSYHRSLSTALTVELLRLMYRSTCSHHRGLGDLD